MNKNDSRSAEQLIAEAYTRLRALNPDMELSPSQPTLTLAGGLISLGWAVVSLFH